MAIASSRSAATGLVIGCVIFGLGSLIVAHFDIGGWAMAFWRLAISGIVFAVLAKMTGQRLPRSKRAVFYGLLSGAFLGLDLALWHESIYAVGPGISTLLNSLQIFFLAAIGFLYFNERHKPYQQFLVHRYRYKYQPMRYLQVFQYHHLVFLFHS